MFLLRVTRDEVMEKMNKENQVNGGFEVPNWHYWNGTVQRCVRLHI